MRKLGTILFFAIIFILFFINTETVHAETGSITVHYSDINANTIKSTGTVACTIGKEVKINISGYTLVEANDNVCGESNVAYLVYQTNGNKKEGTVKVSCYDTKGNKLSKCTDGRSGTVGAEYYINPPTLDGYKFVRVEGPNNGTFKEGSVTVKFIYESTGGNLVEQKQEEKPAAEQKQEETKKEETKQPETKKTETKNNNKVTKTTVVTKKQPVEATKKEETKEEVKEQVKEIPKERTTTIVDNTKDNTGKYIAMSGIFSSLALMGFVIKKSLVK